MIVTRGLKNQSHGYDKWQSEPSEHQWELTKIVAHSPGGDHFLCNYTGDLAGIALCSR